MTRSSLGYAYAYTGRSAQAYELLRSIGEDSGELPDMGMIGWYTLSALAEPLLRQGEVDAACATAVRVSRWRAKTAR